MGCSVKLIKIGNYLTNNSSTWLVKDIDEKNGEFIVNKVIFKRTGEHTIEEEDKKLPFDVVDEFTLLEELN